MQIKPVIEFLGDFMALMQDAQFRLTVAMSYREDMKEMLKEAAGALEPSPPLKNTIKMFKRDKSED